MLTITEILNILHSYNIDSQKFGPTIYINNNDIGLCLDIKDSTFGYLTRYFIFKTKTEVDEFLKKLFWFKNNHNKYPVTLTLDKYDIPNPTIYYKYNEKELKLEQMLNLKNTIKELKEKRERNNLKRVYITHISGLINYLINLKLEKDNIKKEKNNLKKEENDLKFELLEQLTIYYGKEKNLTPKAVSLEIITETNIDELKEKLKNLENLNKEELKNELSTIINNIKEEELDEKNLVNIYSNTIYKYNISILKKQIEFVKSKIEAEKNFNLKGSKIHNIDEELRSFLKTNIAPKKIEDFIKENKKQINAKYNKISNDLDAYPILCKKEIELPQINEVEIAKELDSVKELEIKFDLLEDERKAKLILYNSMYKNICNYIINNNYPDISTIKEKNDFSYLYNELEEIIFNENNSHYLNTYFKYLNFKDLDSYIKSIIEICHTVESIKFEINSPLKVFYIEENNIYKKMILTPIFSNTEKTYMIELNNISLIYIPDKIELDEENKEFNTISNKNIFIKKNIIDSLETITLNKYTKRQKKDKTNNIIITNELILDKQIKFNIGNIGD